ncbi:ERI1 exoribonuclease 2 isoform X1 [Mastacembelus armatus]|uniref:ERI1 exoribonuclease 2 isoform X1 n=1 Tax=Mastacembelus armatus TaxID=205130 RepID=UPI000E4548CC|nr:ERI1 exoribonuclease 2 isoform X1 [Mastacembelus armatus]
MSTKKLAKELGLLRQRSQSRAKKSVVSNQIFSYLIVIDFESTCWREKNSYSQEIIEFPAVLLNTSTGETESEFHTYVQPQEHPILSRFCTELTGITQMQVEAGIPLQICLSRFSRWLQNLQLERGVVFPNKQQRSSAPSPSLKLCAFLTWSDWDLGVCLQYECKRKQLHKPDVLNSWIDLRSTYRQFYDRKPKGLNGALQDLGIQFSGREHSGLDDSRNTAKLAARMMRDGCVMKITRSLERTPSMVKTMFGMTSAHKKEKTNTSKEENTLTTSKPSSPKGPLHACQIKCGADNNSRNLDTKENLKSDPICQSLISPKTLLTGTSTSLWGHNIGKSVKTEAVIDLSSSVVMNCTSPHGENNGLVLCSTTVHCLSALPQPNQPSKTEATVGLVEEEDGAELLVEAERYGSYDDVVLEGDDFFKETDRECDTEYISDYESGCYVREEPGYPHSAGAPFIFGNSISCENYSKTEIITNELSTTSVSAKMIKSNVNISDHLNNTRQPSAVSEPDAHFAVPKTNPHKTGLRNFLHFQNESSVPQKYFKTNTPSIIRPKSFVPEKTSTPNTSFARPKAVITQHAKHKETPKSSFTIFTDPAKQAAAPAHPSSSISVYTPKNVLSSLSTNTLSSSTNRASIPVKVKEGGKITSPLCACGRRAKRQVVSNGGPNHGRRFYCCPVRRSGSGGRIQKGCEFFKWESCLMKPNAVASVAVRSSVSLCQINSTLNYHPQQRSTLRKSC